MNSLVVYDVTSGSESEASDSVSFVIKQEPVDTEFESRESHREIAGVLETIIKNVSGDSSGPAVNSLLTGHTIPKKVWTSDADWPKPAVPIKEEPYESDSDFGHNWRIDRDLITSDSSGGESLDEILGEHSAEFKKKHKRKTKKSLAAFVDSEDSDEDLIFAKAIEFTRRKRLEAELGPRTYDGLDKQIRNMPRTRGELRMEDLPPIEKLSLNFDHKVHYVRVGVVSSAVDTLVVVKSDFDLPPLDENTVLFIDSSTQEADGETEKNPIGEIFETFGPVPRPSYSIRFNETSEIEELSLVPGKTVVYFAPKEEEITKTVFTDALRKMKGSDASWKEDNEPPSTIQYFSDDEEERRFKAKNRRKKQIETEDPDQTVVDISADGEVSPDIQITGHVRGRRGRGRGNRGASQGSQRGRGYSGESGRGRRGGGPSYPSPQTSAFPPRPQFCWPPRGGMNPELQYPPGPFQRPMGNPFQMMMGVPIFPNPASSSPYGFAPDTRTFPTQRPRVPFNSSAPVRGPRGRGHHYQPHNSFTNNNWPGSNNRSGNDSTDTLPFIDTRFMETE